MSIEFYPTMKNMSVSGGKVKIVLEVEKIHVKSILGSISDLEGEYLRIELEKQQYKYAIPYDKSNDAARLTYEVNQDGTINNLVEEQTNLLDGADDVEERFFFVERSIVDEFIMACPRLEYPGPIVPKDIIKQIKNKISIHSIAQTYEMTEGELNDELEKARSYYAPYADKWHLKRERDGFSFDEVAD